MGLLFNEFPILLGRLPAKSDTDFFYMKHLKKEPLLIFLMIFFLLAIVFIAITFLPSFNLFGTATHPEKTLSSANDFIFGVVLALTLLSCFLACGYIFLLSLFGRDVVLIQDGILEMSFGMTLIRNGPCLPISTVESIELSVFEDEYSASASKISKELIINVNGKTMSHRINEMFTEQDITELRAALTASKKRVSLLTSESVAESASKSLIEPAHVENHDDLSTSAADEGKNSLWALLIANSIPLFGAYFLGWQLTEIIVLYWAETLVLLFYQSIRNIAVSPLKGLLLSLRNSAHIIVFASGQFLMIWAFFIQKVFENSSPAVDESLTTVFNYFISIWPALVALVASHGYSLYLHFFKNPNASKVLLPVKPLFFRIGVMHATIILGVILVILTDGYWATLLLLMALKTLVDAIAHCKQHDLQM